MPAMKILGIETSCDETAISIVGAKGSLEDFSFKVLGSVVNSQIDIHKEYGGVVPNIAKREHQKNLPLVLAEALKIAEIDLSKIDLISVTVGPGLEPALWTGITFAKEISEKWNIPVVGANHMEGHIASVFLTNSKEETSRTIFSLGHKDKALQNDSASFLNIKENKEGKNKFPILALLISGGHTELIFLKNWLEKEKIGETKDDAVGEAFDKVARMLGLPYPGGPEISKLAEEARIKNIKLEKEFPRPMIHSGDFNFSFSGLKTAVLYYLRDKKEINKIAVAREFEDAVIETLISKTKKAISEYQPKTLIIGGGVIANKALRENFLKLKEIYPKIEILIPEKSLTTDNATMIAAAGYLQYLKNENESLETGDLKAQGNLSIN